MVGVVLCVVDSDKVIIYFLFIVVLFIYEDLKMCLIIYVGRNLWVLFFLYFIIWCNVSVGCYIMLWKDLWVEVN